MNIKFWIRRGMRSLSAIVLTLILSFSILTGPVLAYSQADLDHLLKTNECNDCDLSGADLSGADLYGSAILRANLSGANLSQALLNDAKLSRSDLTNANLSDAILMGITLSGANLTNADLTHADLYNALLNDATFSEATLADADLTSAILSCTNPADVATCTDLSNVKGQSAIFNNAILSGADLSAADFSDAAMRDTDLSNATLQGTLLCNADLFRAIMPNSTIYNGDVAQFGADNVCVPVAESPTPFVIPSPLAPSVAYCPDGVPIFPNPDNVFLGITPTGWSNSDDPSIDLVPPIPYQQILSEMSLAGFKGSQMSGKYPSDMDVLKSELALRGLTISEPWVGTFFTIGATEDSQKIFDQQLQFMQDIGQDTIVVAELGGAVHQQPIAPLPNRPIYTEAQWDLLLTGLNDLGQQANAAGMKFVYHPHVGTGVESLDDIRKLMAGTNPDYVQLLLDTGHLYYSGVDPLTVTQEFADRIKHVHLKNIRQDILDSSIADGLSFLNSIRAGVFTVPGDPVGAIDFQPIFDTLAAADYQGWLVVEAEQDPNKANPLQYALMARYYLCDATGL